MDNKLVFFNKSGDALNFNFDEQDQRYEGKLIFDHNSDDTFKTIGLYMFEKIESFEYSQGEQLKLGKFQLFNEYGINFSGSSVSNFQITGLEAVNDDSTFSSKWVFGEEIDTQLPVGTQFRFDQSWIEFNDPNVVYTVVQSKKGAIMFLSNIDNEGFNIAYGGTLSTPGIFDDKTVSGINTIGVERYLDESFDNNLSEWSEPTFYADLFDKQKMTVVNSESNDNVYCNKNVSLLDNTYKKYFTTTAQLPEGEDLVIQVKLKTDIPLIYDNNLVFVTGDNRINFNDTIPALLKSGTEFQVLNSLSNQGFLRVSPITLFNNDGLIPYLIEDLVVYENNIYQCLQSYTQSATSSTTPSTDTVLWGAPNHLFTDEDLNNETVFTSQLFLTTNILNFVQTWDTDQDITFASARERYASSLSIFNIDLQFDDRIIANEADDELSANLILPTNYAEIDFFAGTGLTNSIMQDVVFLEKIVEVEEILTNERNNDKSELFDYKIVVTDMDEFGLYVDLNGQPYFTETSFTFDGVEVDLPRTIDSTLRDFLKNYFVLFFSMGIIVELKYTGAGSSIWVNTIHLKTAYPNVPIDFGVRVGTTADFFIPHSYVVFYEMGNLLTIDLNNRTYQENFDTDIKTTLSNWVDNNLATIDLFGITVKSINQALYFEVNEQDTRVDYSINIGQSLKPGQLAYEITRQIKGNLGVVIASNRIFQENPLVDFEDEGFATGMLMSINNSPFVYNNQEYNSLFLDPDKIILSYQGPFWGATSSGVGGFSSFAFDDGFGFDPLANNIIVEISPTFSTQEVDTTSNPFDILHVPLSDSIYVLGDDLTVIDGTEGSLVKDIILGTSSSLEMEINPINNLLYALTEDFLFVVDPLLQTLVATVSMVGETATDIAINTDTGDVYVTLGSTSSINVYDINNTLTTSISTNFPSFEIVYHKGEEVMYAVAGSELIRINGDTQTIIGTPLSPFSASFGAGYGLASRDLFYNEFNEKIYGFDDSSLFSADVNGIVTLASVPSGTFSAFIFDPNTDNLYVSTDDNIIYELDAADNLTSNKNIGDHGFLQYNELDNNIYISTQVATQSLIVYNTAVDDLIGVAELTGDGGRMTFAPTRGTIWVVIPGGDVVNEIKTVVESASLINFTAFTAAFGSAYGFGLSSPNPPLEIVDNMYGTLDPEYVPSPYLLVKVREFIRRPRENFNDDPQIQYKWHWLEDQTPEIFMYDFSGGQLGDEGSLTYVGEKPLTDIRLNATKNNNIDNITNPTVQQTVFLDTTHTLELVDSRTDLSFVPEPIELFLGFQSKVEGVKRSTLLLSQLENVSFDIVTDSTNMNEITFRHLANNDGTSSGEICLNTLSTDVFLEKGLKPNQIIQIFVKDNSNNTNQAISFNNGKKFRITNVFNRTLTLEYCEDQLVDETTIINNHPTAGVNTYFTTTFTVADKELGRFEIFGETEIEDIRFKINLGNEGKLIRPDDTFIYRKYDIKEQGYDWHFLNKKRKELLFTKHEIFPYIGSYKSIINAINHFGYNELELYEYYRNINRDSKLFGKLFKVEIPDIFDNTVDGWSDNDFIKHTMPNVNYEETNLFNLTFRITDREGTNVLLFTLDEVLVKLNGLKHWLENNIVPLTHDILDITGRADFVGVKTIRHQSFKTQIVNINSDFTPVNCEINEAYVLPVSSGSTVYNVVSQFSVESEENLPDYFTLDIRTYQIYDEWEAFTTYTLGDTVRYLGKQYESVLDTITDDNKLNNPTKYQDSPDFSLNVTYTFGSVVEYNRDFYKFIAATAGTASSTPFNNDDWLDVTEWKEINLQPVQYLQEYRRIDNLLPYNFTIDTNIDPYVEVKLTSENGYGQNITIKKNVEVRFDADSNAILNIF